MSDPQKPTPDPRKRAAERERPEEAASDETKRPSDSVPVTPGPFATLPAKFGRYHVEKLLGRGAMGAVYLARDTQLDRRVALKIPKVAASGSKRLLLRLETEAKAAAKLDHQCLCKVHDAGQIDGQCFIAMQYIEGETLKSQLAVKGKSVAEAVSLIRQLAEGLSEAHELGIIHRDLKPENIMINRRGTPVIMDFGLAKLSTVTGHALATQAGTILGTPTYMSPEQASGNIQEIDQRSDIYSLGIILFELLTGTWPFSGSAMQILGQKSLLDPVSPASLKPDLSPRLAAICHKMIARTNADRYQTLAEVIADLRSLDAAVTPTVEAPTFTFDFQPQVDAPVKRTPAPNGRPALPPRQVLIGGLAAGLILLLGIVLWIQSGDALIKVEVFSEDVEVKFQNDTIKLADGAHEYHVTPGDHTLLIKSGNAEYMAEKLTLKKGNNPTVTVELVDSKVVAKAGPKRIPLTRLPQSDRSMASQDDARKSTGDGKPETAKSATAPSAATQHQLPALLAYAARVGHAGREFDDARVPALQKSLESLRPKLAEPDARGWEWYYLHAFASRLQHVSPASAFRVAYSPNGKYLATLGPPETLNVLETATWQPLEKMPQMKNREGSEANAALAWSPDNKLIAGGETVKVIDVEGATELRELLPGTAAAEWVGWNPQGTHLAAACRDGSLRIWRAGDWKLEWEAAGKIGALKSASWESTGNRIAVGGLPTNGFNVGGATILLSSKGQELSRWDVTAKHLSWQPNGDWLTIPRAGSVGIEIWSVQAGKRDSYWFNTGGGVFQPAWSRDGQRLGFVDIAGEAWVLDPSEKFQAAAVYRFAKVSGYAIDFSPDRRQISMGIGRAGAIIFDASEPAETCVIDWDHGGAVIPVEICFNNSGYLLAATDDRRGLAVWSLKSPRKLLWKTGPAKARLLTFDHRQERLAYVESSERLKFVQAETGQVIRTVPLDGHSVVAMCWPAGDSVRQLSDNGAVTTVSASNAGTLSEVGTLSQSCKLGHFTADGSQLVAVTADGRVRVAKGPDFKTHQEVNLSESKPPLDVRWNSDGSQLAVITASRSVKIWSARSQQVTQTLEGSELTTAELAWNNSGDRLATISIRPLDARYIEPDVTIWDTASGQRLLSLASGHEEARRIAWSHDGRQLAAFDKAGRVRIWDASREYELERSSAPARTLTMDGARQKVLQTPDNSTAPSNRDRRAAEWVFSARGKVALNGGFAALASASELPQGEFRVTSIYLNRNETVTLEGMRLIAQLQHLDELQFSGKSLTDEGLSLLTGLGSLKRLALINSRISPEGLRQIAGFTNLESLMLAGSALSDGEIDMLIALPRLGQLWIENTSLTEAGVRRLAALKNLEWLAVSGLPVTDETLKALSAMKQLRMFRAASTQLTDDGVQYLREMSQLVDVDLSGTKITDVALEHLEHLPAMQSLVLRQCAITDEGVVHLKKLGSLQNLYLDGTRITDRALPHLSALQKLETLWVKDTAVTPAGIASLRKLLPNCKLDIPQPM